MVDLAPAQVAQLVEWGEAEALANFYHCVPADFAQQFRVEAKRVGSIWVSMIPALDSSFFNRLMGLGLGDPLPAAELDEAIAVLQAAGCQRYMAQVSPLAQPPQLAGWLEQRGFVRGRQWAKVYRGSEPAPVAVTDLRVEAIGTDQAETFATIGLAAFEMAPALRPWFQGIVGQPGWYTYLGWAGEQAVAIAAMYVAGDVAWLGVGATLAPYRRHGGQAAMLARRIADGLKLGCQWFVTETGEDTPTAPNPSYHNMLRAGFQLAYLRPNYVYAGPVSAPAA